MNTVIQFTPSQLLQIFVASCVAITTIAGAVAVIVKAFQIIKKPERTQDERLEVLEKKVDRFEQLFDNDNKRLIELEKGNRVTQQAFSPVGNNSLCLNYQFYLHSSHL